MPTPVPSSAPSDHEIVLFPAVIPAGPNANIDYIRDTIDSICFYTMPRRRIIVMDEWMAMIPRW